MERFGEELRILRKRRGISLRQLTRELDSIPTAILAEQRMAKPNLL